MFFTVPSNSKLTLGELRNLSIEKSNGEYFCQWDDDDWSHSERLKIQFKELKRNKKDASILAYWIMFDKVNNNAYLSLPHMWAGTILCKKSIVNQNIKYPTTNVSEDAMFLGMLYDENCVYPIIMTTLYIYVYHGKNTMTAKHFKQFFAQSQNLSHNTSLLIRNILDYKYNTKDGSKILDSFKVLNELDYFFFNQLKEV